MLIKNPDNMKEMFEKNNQLLNQAARGKLRQKIDELINEKCKPQFRTSLEEYILAGKRPDEYSGFARFDLEKIINMKEPMILFSILVIFLLYRLYGIHH